MNYRLPDEEVPPPPDLDELLPEELPEEAEPEERLDEEPLLTLLPDDRLEDEPVLMDEELRLVDPLPSEDPE
jgi:hypothetical protein